MLKHEANTGSKPINLIDRKIQLLEKEEKELLDEQEVEKFILNHLFSDIMEEVMDLGGDHNVFVPPKKKSKAKNKGPRISLKHSK